MPQKTKARAGATARGLGLDQLDGSISPNDIHHLPITQAQLSSAIVVSDGRRTLGYIVESKGNAIAVSLDGHAISTHRSRREAFKSISAASGRAAQPSSNSAR
jgi:hypothetical protein